MLEECTCNSCLLCVLSIYYESPRPPHIKLPSQVACPHIVCELIAWVTIKSLMSLICAKQNYHSWDFTRSMIPSYLPTGFCKGVGIPFHIVEQKYGGIKSVFNVRIDLWQASKVLSIRNIHQVIQIVKSVAPPLPCCSFSDWVTSLDPQPHFLRLP